ncbi:MAG: YraN family protein [bacterium]
MQEKTSKNKGLGDAGEDAAAGYLVEHGFRIIARNVRYKRGEIDIVAARKGELHFIEVRTRSSTNFLDPIASITEAKRKRIRLAAQCYLADSRNGFTNRELPPCFFGVIGIDLSNKNNEIECIIDAFV